LFTAKHRNQFLDSKFPKSYLPPIRGYSWHKNEIKRIRRGHYISYNFQDSTKEKLLKENMGYLPRVLFFNAFELDTIILKDAHVRNKSLKKKRASKKYETLLSLTHFLAKEFCKKTNYESTKQQA
jgi:hypothetical protein